MNSSSIEALLRSALAPVLSSGCQELVSHPEALELASYLMGESPRSERDRIAEHLVFCPECLRLTLALAESEGGPTDTLEPAALESRKRRAWESLEEELRALGRPYALFLAPSQRRPRFSAWWALAAAASLLLVAGFMGRLGFSPAPNPLDGPVANLLIADLLPAGYTVRGLGSEEPR